MSWPVLDLNHAGQLLSQVRLALKVQHTRFESLVGPLREQLRDANENTQGELTLALPGELLQPFCEGHFDADPLVPGAYQIGLGAEILQATFGPISQVRRAGFRTPLRPEAGAKLRAKRRPTHTRVELLTSEGEPASRFELSHAQVSDEARIQTIEAVHDEAWSAHLLDAKQVRASLRHRPPALFISHQRSGSAGVSEFAGIEREAWHWSEALDGAAQASGLAFRREAGHEGQPVYVAAFEQIALDLRAPLVGAPLFRVRFVRRVMALNQFSFVIIDAQRGRPCCSGLVALAAAPADGERGP